MSAIDDATPGTDVAMLLAQAGLTVLEGTSQDGYYGTMPDGKEYPDRVLVVTDRGNEPATVAAADQINRVMIRVRGQVSDIAWHIARAIKVTDALNGLGDMDLPDTGQWLVVCKAWNVGDIGRDSRGRPIAVVEARLYVMNPTPLRG